MFSPNRPSIKLYCDIDYDPFLLMKDQGKVYGTLIYLNSRPHSNNSYQMMHNRFHALLIRIYRDHTYSLGCDQGYVNDFNLSTIMP